MGKKKSNKGTYDEWLIQTLLTALILLLGGVAAVYMNLPSARFSYLSFPLKVFISIILVAVPLIFFLITFRNPPIKSKMPWQQFEGFLGISVIFPSSEHKYKAVIIQNEKGVFEATLEDEDRETIEFKGKKLDKVKATAEIMLLELERQYCKRHGIKCETHL